MIPIHNERGELVAYCGRAVDGSQPRYRFPPDSPNRKSCSTSTAPPRRRKRVVVVVEGFFDCLQLHQAGVCAVVALMGSALYEPQQRLLLQRFPRVILMLDGDAAGRRATADIAAQLRLTASVQVIHLARTDAAGPDCPTEPIRHVLVARRRSRTHWPSLLEEVSASSCQPQRR